MFHPDPMTHREFYDGVPIKRLIAWFIDMVIVVILSALIVPFTAFTGLFFFPLLVIVVGFFYRIATLASGGATWGMAIMAIELRDTADRPLDFSIAVLHTIGYSISIAITPLQVISILLMATSTKGQGITDILLGTVALNRRRRY